MLKPAGGSWLSSQSAMALTWEGRVSFVLTDTLQIKKVTMVDGVLDHNAATSGDGKDDRFDADAAIATGELSQMMVDLLMALGGEVTMGLPAATATDTPAAPAKATRTPAADDDSAPF